MSNPIKTTGTTSDPVSTTHKPNEPTADWVDRHNKAVTASTPSGDTLTTQWNSSATPRTTTTRRNPAESDAEFVLRHQNDYLTAMIENPPEP